MTNSPAGSGKGRSGGEFWSFRLRGQIQGVGFRPFVYRLANEIGIAGTVCNDPGGVTIEAAGTAAALAEFERRLRTEAPALARVDGLVRERRSGIGGGGVAGFVIIASDHEPAARGRVTVDAAVCADCLAELFTAGGRRYRHGLINCTNCGPRYSIVRDLPYDRPLTTMADFAMCDDCAGEYVAAGDRRFHAQPTCCVACGPRVELRDAAGELLGGDPFVEAGRLLRSGLIIALKGLGGYHLVADATSASAVARLRARKKRDGGKPFAVMVGDFEEAGRWGDFSVAAREVLESVASPIVIVRRKRGAGGEGGIVEGVAPRQEYLGLMLPNTPMQHLLMAEMVGAGGVGGAVVMTSANVSDDPLIIDDEEAFVQLQGVADFWLRHDRPIERAVDDSIYRDFGNRDGVEGGLIPIRRARGLVPMPVDLPLESRGAGCCLGADLKNTVALVRGREVIASQHLGDLTYARAYARFAKTLADLARLFEVVPEWLAVDLHPGYLSRQYGLRWARAAGDIKVIEVQHHHAHLAAVMAEHGRTARTIGLICDGVGYGVDGSAWGGEVLVGDLRGFERVGCLRGLRLPGGDAAAKQPGRCGLAWLVDALGLEAAGSDAWSERLIADAGERKFLLGMLAGDLNCPPSTGMGRLFDGAAALLGFCTQNHYEAESGQLLESAALRAERHLPAAGWLPLVAAGRGGSGEHDFEIDTRPLLRALCAQLEGGAVTVEELAWMFHDALAGALTESAERAREGTGIDTVGISGGVFCNGLLTALTIGRLEERGFTVLRHRVFPPNDGGIAFGQAAVATARLARGGSE